MYCNIDTTRSVNTQWQPQVGRQKLGMEIGGTAHEESTEGTMPPWKIGLRDVADRLLSL